MDAARQVLRKWGFHEAAFFPIMIATATEGGAELFPLVYFDKEAFLAQSAQLYKQSLVPALGRVFSIAPSFRAEKSRTRKHLTEFWQIDVEGAFLTKKDIMEIEFDIYRTAAQRLADENEEELKLLGVDDIVIPNRYETIGYDEAIEILPNSLKMSAPSTTNSVTTTRSLQRRWTSLRQDQMVLNSLPAVRVSTIQKNWQLACEQRA